MPDDPCATAATDDDLLGACLLCGHDYDSHGRWRDVPIKHVPCPKCPDGLCLDPQPQAESA